MKLFYISVLSLLFFACTEDPSDEVIDTQDPEEIYEQVDQVFEGPKFDNPKHLEILEKLNVCEMNAGDSSLIADCSPSNFKIIPFRSDKTVEQAFILETKAGIVLKGGSFPLPVRHVIVFEEEAGEYVKVNGFRGELLEMYKTESGIKGLNIVFYLAEHDVASLCSFEWENNNYTFKRVEAIDYGEGFKAVKAEHQEEVNNDMYNDLIQAKLIFNEKSSI